MSTVMTADQLLAAKGYKTEEMDFLGGRIVVRTMPMGGRIAMRTQALTRVGDKAQLDDLKFAAVTLQFGLFEPRLTMAQAEQLVAEQPAEVLEPVLDAIWRLSGMSGAEGKNA